MDVEILKLKLKMKMKIKKIEKIDTNIPYQDIIRDSEYKKCKDMEETKSRYIGERIM